EKPPYLMVGHSMAAVHLQVFALRWPELVCGMVLIDAVPPAALVRPDARRFVRFAGQMSALARTGSVLRLTALTAPLFGDAIGVRGLAHKEKL
ncbi:alpha/beta hydrolase, partial [Acinetobacter baumannii]